MVSSLLLALILFFLLKFFKIKIIEPAGLFSYVWLLFILGSIIFLKREYQFFYSGINWILFSAILFTICAALFSKVNPRTIVNSSQELSFVMPWWLLSFFLALAFLRVMYLIYSQGASLSVFSDFSTLQSFSHQASVQRYSGEESFSIIGQLLGTFIYATPLCAGYSLVYAKKKWQKLLCYSSFFPPLLSMLLTSAKLAVISYVIFVFVGYYVSYLARYKQLPQVNVKLLSRLSIAFVTLLGLFYISFVLRIGQTSENVVGTIITKLAIYAFGHIQAFDLWFEEFAFRLPEYGFGISTFLAISSQLGLATKKIGIYDFIFGASSNVYTQFRGLIEDFGPILSLGILVILFILCYYCIVLVKKKPLAILPQVVLSATLFYLLYFIVSAWAYTFYIITFIIFCIYLFVARYIRFVHRRR